MRPNQLYVARRLAGFSRRTLAALCMMSVGTLAAVEEGRAYETNPGAVDAVRKTLELHGIRFTPEGATRA